MICFTFFSKTSIIIPSSEMPEQHYEYTNTCNDENPHDDIKRQGYSMFVQNT